MLANDKKWRRGNGEWSLRGTIDDVRQSLFGEASSEQCLVTEGGLVRTERLDVEDETVVRRLVSESGGRLPQSAVVARTDWSAAKVSRLLTQMEKRDQIDRVRVGRKKVVVGPDSGVDRR